MKRTHKNAKKELRQAQELEEYFDWEIWKMQKIEMSGLKEAMDVLKEYREYRKIGTVEECQEAMDAFKKLYKKDQKDDLILVYVEAGCQEILARMKLVRVKELEEMGIYGKAFAVLYDIEDKLKPFPMYSKVKLLGRECMFCLGNDKELGQRVLIQTDCKDSEFWFGKVEAAEITEVYETCDSAT